MAAADENFEAFVRNWEIFQERLVIFLGAGASIGARNSLGKPLPNAFDLRNELWKRYKTPKGQPFDPSELKLMSLEHAASIVEVLVGRDELTRYLLENFACDRPLWQHLVLPHLNPKAIFTTNYDELVELGYKSHAVVPDVVCDSSPVGAGRTAIYKPHGSLGHATQPVGKGALVITQFDYFEMISDYRAMLEKAMTGFGESCVLIAGYSFGDMDIGAELFKLRRQSKGTPWYAIFPRDDPQVKRMYSNRLGVEQINMTLEQFLRELDRRVNFIPGKHKFSKMRTLTTGGLVQRE